MNVDRVVIRDEYATGGHRLIIIGAQPGVTGRWWLAGADKRLGLQAWEPLTENADTGHPVGIPLPEGVLDAIVREHLGVAAPTPATERHLLDAIAVRDRLLALVESGRS